MRREERLLLGVAEASRLFLQGERADDVLPRALGVLGSAAQADRAYLFQNETDPTSGELLMSHRYEWVRPGVSPQIGNPALVRLPYSRAMPAPWLGELLAGESLPVLVRDVPEERRALLEEQGIQSLLLAPIHVGSRFWGTVGLDDCRAAREWTEEERAILAVAAASIGAFVTRREAEEERRKGEERFRTLVEGSADCIWEMDSGGRFTYLGPSFQELTGIPPEEAIGRGAEAFLSPPEAERLKLFFEELGRDPRRFTSLRVVIQRRDGREVVAESTGLPSLDADGRVVGFRGSTRDVTERDRAARLQAALFAIADAAGASQDLGELYRRVHEILAGLMPARNFYIALIDGERQWIDFAYFVDEEDPAPQARPLGKGLTEYVFRSGRTLLASPEGFQQLRASGDVVPIGSPSVDWLGTPLKVAERTIGILAVQSYTEGTRYTATDARMLEFVSTHVALAIERTRVQDERRRTLERLAEAQAIAHVGSWELFPGHDPEVLLSDEGCRLVGAPSPAGIRTAAEFFSLLVPEDGEALAAAVRRARDEGAPFTLDVRTRAAADARSRTLHVQGRPAFREAGRADGVVATLLDVTERKRTEKALRAATGEMTESIAELERRNLEISLLAEMGRLLLASRNPAEAHAVTARFGPRLFEGASGALLVVERERDTLRRVAAWGDGGATTASFARDDCWALRALRPHRVDGRQGALRCPHSSQPEPCWSLCLPLAAQGDLLGVLSLERTTPFETEGRAEAAERLAGTAAEQLALALASLDLREILREQATHDSVTGLYNRRYLEEALEREIRRAERKGTRLGLLLLDLDRFKPFNDSYGHDAGDALLRSFGAFLRARVRAGDVACRYGGDEFTVLLPEANEENVHRRAEELRQKVREMPIPGLPPAREPVTLSAGGAVYPDNGKTSAELLRAADEALYRAKAEGRDRVTMAAAGWPTTPEGEAPVRKPPAADG